MRAIEVQGLPFIVSNPRFTIFIPCFNRGHTIARALDSAREQVCSDYEILVVDDGSIDDSRAVIQSWETRNGLPIRYFYQENQGKHVAHNTGVQHARGELFTVLDSDDVMLPDCLAAMQDAWEAIPDAERVKFAGVEGLCIDSQGKVHGTCFPEDVFDSDYLAVVGQYGVTGEKRNCIRLDVLRKFPYPVIPGEYHIRPSFLWKQIAHRYRMRFINKPLQVVDFAPDGLTATASIRRLRNTSGLYAYWRDDVLHHQKYLSDKQRRRHYAEYFRYALHAGVGVAQQWREVPDWTIWLQSAPRGLSNYLGDLLKQQLYYNTAQ